MFARTTSKSEDTFTKQTHPHSKNKVFLKKIIFPLFSEFDGTPEVMKGLMHFHSGKYSQIA